jgi:hypothetical protein
VPELLRGFVPDGDGRLKAVRVERHEFSLLTLAELDKVRRDHAIPDDAEVSAEQSYGEWVVCVEWRVPMTPEGE